MALLPVACASHDTKADSPGGDGDGGLPGECVPGVAQCDGNTLLRCQDGELVEDALCDEVCVPNLGCVLCTPGFGTCEGENSARVCTEDGMGYELQECDAVQGMSCDPSIGACVGACSQQSLGQSYIGCDYYPTITGNGLLGDWDFAIIISNTSGSPAHLLLEGGSSGISEQLVVPANEVSVKRLPYDPVMQFCNSVLGAYCTVPQPYGGGRAGGAFRLRSDQPVTVYQFSPLDYVMGDTLSYSNDASLLLPANTLGNEYVVATWPTWVNPDRNPYPGIVAITATQDNTEVTITPSAFARPFGRPGVTETLTMDRGDVMQLASDPGEVNFNLSTYFTEDLTGTQVRSDKPVQVIGAHFCTRIPVQNDACDHLEESIFPVKALSNRYVAPAPYSASFERAPFITRVIATAPNTSLSFEPALPGVGTSLGEVGDFVEIGPQDLDLVISADHKIVVAQYMLAETIVGTGDPSMNLPSPIEQWRSSYLFHAPTNYAQNIITIVRSAGTDVRVDGSTVNGWQAIGSSEFEAAHVQLGSGSAGDHQLEADGPVGLSVYGYGQATSYWYPGGLDLKRIVID